MLRNRNMPTMLPLRGALRWWLERRLPRDRDPGAVQVHGVVVPAWECHVCGRRRPDELIAVHTAHYSVFTGERVFRPSPDAVTVNVRYCTDQRVCADGAPAKATEWTRVLREAKRNRDSARRVLRGR
jgi:hypothetical protein